MTRQEAAVSLKTITVIFIVIGVLLIGIGFYKHLAYEHNNSEYSYYDDSVNAYVGSDAYNYIINGTYFTAYSVLGVGSFIIATITGVGAMFMSVKLEKKVTMLNNNESNFLGDFQTKHTEQKSISGKEVADSEANSIISSELQDIGNQIAELEDENKSKL